MPTQPSIPPGLTLQRTLSGHTDVVLSVAWSPDGRLLASSSLDDTIRLWEAATGAHLHTLEGHTSSVFSVAWSPDAHLLASGCLVDTIHLWETATGKLLHTLKGHTNGI